MILQTKGPPRGDAASPIEGRNCLGDSSDPPTNPAPAQANLLRNPRAVREAKLELLREALHEACGFIRIHAEVCQALAEAGDDSGAMYSLGRLVTFTKYAARVGNDLRAVRGAPE
ncbi:MAG: hypothetical protein M3Z96_02195 [Pseudomonadota bacterium]|nr:hypothetical protein [Pseudomonadota bacterium]